MMDTNALPEYGDGQAYKYQAFSKSSLISIWPALHRSPIVWIALMINTAASLLSVYSSTFLDKTSSISNYALLILLVTTFSGLAIFVSATLVSWICLIEENTVRRYLARTKAENTSLANIDLPIAISTISFYIMAPAQLASILVYSGYVLYRSPSTMIYLVIIVLLSAYPLYFFAKWRRRMIRVIRSHRNQLVDECGSSSPDAYSVIVTSYSFSVMEYFWRNVQAIYLLRLIVFMFLLFVLLSGRVEQHGVSVLVALMLLMTGGHAFFNSVCMFQEDRISLARVRAALDF